MPDEGFGVGIVGVDVVTDRSFEFSDAGVRAALDPLFTDLPKEPLHQVEPGRRGRGEVHVVARPLRKPCAHLLCLVGAVVVHDQVNLLIRRHCSIDRFQELQELGAAMASLESVREARWTG